MRKERVNIRWSKWYIVGRGKTEDEGGEEIEEEIKQRMSEGRK